MSEDFSNDIKVPCPGSAEDAAFKEEYRSYSLDAEAAIRILLARIKNLQCNKSEKGPRMLVIEEPLTRIKKEYSCKNKLKMNDLEITPKNLRSKVRDMTGIRVVTLYVDDIYALMGALQNQTGLDVVRVKDYIDDPEKPKYTKFQTPAWKKLGPKESGYTSLQATINVEVFYFGQKITVPVEVQFWDVFMYAWSKLQHPLCYKCSGEMDPRTSEFFLDMAEQFKGYQKTAMELRDYTTKADEQE